MRLARLAAAPLVSAGFAALLLVNGSASGSPAASTGSAFGRAIAVQVVVPGESGAVAAAVSAPPSASSSSGGFSYPADGSIVRAGSLAARVSTTHGGARVRASVDVASLSLFGGEVTAGAIAMRAAAAAARGKASGDVSGASVSGVTALGQAVAAAPNARVSLGDWGYAAVLEENVSAAAARTYRGSVTALHVYLTADHGGLPAGSEILVGYGEAGAEVKTTPPSASSKRSAARGDRERARPRDRKRARQRESKRKNPVRLPPSDVRPKLTAGRHVFPVYGPSSFGDTYGAARASVGWHHGEDIFAPLGAPVLAVTDGTIFSVGWNRVGGNRLWLRDTAGNQFYYAHLSAFSPLAVNGRRVQAGDVIGFVGTTGDAEGTPPHLHFEIHPVSLLYMGYDGAIRAAPYLRAWQRLEDVRFTTAVALAELGFALPVAPGSAAPRPGAILLGVSDISSASGLDPAALERALTDSMSAEDYGAFAAFLPASAGGAGFPTSPAAEP